MAVTLAEVKEYLATQRVKLPDRMIQYNINKVAALQACFDKHGYSEEDVYYITVTLTALIAAVSGSDGRIKSQSAPSGASRSFDYQSLSDKYQSLRNLLRNVDPHGCTDALVPRDPTKKNRCALFVSPGVQDNCA